jgi:hypothetical protein
MNSEPFTRQRQQQPPILIIIALMVLFVFIFMAFSFLFLSLFSAAHFSLVTAHFFFISFASPVPGYQFLAELFVCFIFCVDGNFDSLSVCLSVSFVCFLGVFRLETD